MYQTRDTFDNTTQYDLPFVLLNTSYHLNTTLFFERYPSHVNLKTVFTIVYILRAK